MPDVPSPRPAPDDLTALADAVGVLRTPLDALDFEHVPMCEARPGFHDKVPPADFLVIVGPTCSCPIHPSNAYLCSGCWRCYAGKFAVCNACKRFVAFRAEALR
ncbi:MAG: hypothetical protein QM714_02820 [Nocardioides sp.]|uniref:hypothetical protein n=1 Tax=Nocardioides sp. TaxID=35761 RepID=UPI0039E2E90B